MGGADLSPGDLASYAKFKIVLFKILGPGPGAPCHTNRSARRVKGSGPLGHPEKIKGPVETEPDGLNIGNNIVGSPARWLEHVIRGSKVAQNLGAWLAGGQKNKIVLFVFLFLPQSG